MTFQIDNSVHWTDHFVEHGFAKVEGLIEPAFCAAAIERVKELFDEPRPLNQWTMDKPGMKHEPFRSGKSDPLLRQVCFHWQWHVYRPSVTSLQLDPVLPAQIRHVFERLLFNAENLVVFTGRRLI